MENEINILICTNSSYMQHVAVCLRSLLDNNAEVCFNIVVVGRSSETLDETALRESLPDTAMYKLSFQMFSPPMDQVLPLNPNAKYTLDIWTRVWVSNFFDADVSRVLYLDGDIVVTGSISELWDTPMGDSLLAAVDIPGSQRGVNELGLEHEDGYFNSGVLLFNLIKWREINALNVVLEYVSKNFRILRDPDQDALNACFTKIRHRLDYKWNAIGPFFREPLALPLPREVIEDVREKAVIIHFNGASKPWDYMNAHPRKKEYWRYLKKTKWSNYVPKDMTINNMARTFVSRVIPKPLKAIIKSIVKPLLT